MYTIPMNADILIIGSGVAGLRAALSLDQRFNVVILTKSTVSESSTGYAQGGVAAVWGEDDSADLHMEDTINAGYGLCNNNAVNCLVNEGPMQIKSLMDLGMKFDKVNGEFDLIREGAHQTNRIFHIKDHTGKALHETLLNHVKKKKIYVLSQIHMLVKLKKKDPKFKVFGPFTKMSCSSLQLAMLLLPQEAQVKYTKQVQIP